MLQTFKEKRDQEQSDGAQRENAETVKLNDMKSQTRKMEASIREAAKNKIENIKAESALKVQRLKDSTVSRTIMLNDRKKSFSFFYLILILLFT